MALITKQVSVGTSAVPLVTVPPGPCQVTVSVAAAATVFVYLGGSGVTTANGSPVTGGQSVAIDCFEGSAGMALYAIASAASTPVGVIVSTADSGTGP